MADCNLGMDQLMVLSEPVKRALSFFSPSSCSYRQKTECFKKVNGSLCSIPYIGMEECLGYREEKKNKKVEDLFSLCTLGEKKVKA